MDVVVVAVIVTTLLGAPDGIILSFALAVVTAAVRSQGTPRERAMEVLETRFLWASAMFSLAALVLEDWQAVALVWLLAAFVINAWRRRGTATDLDRSGLVARFAAALTGLAMAWVIINWVTTPTAVWLVAVAMLAGGLFGMVVRWPDLPWFAGTFSKTRSLGLAGNLAMCALIIAVPLV